MRCDYIRLSTVAAGKMQAVINVIMIFRLLKFNILASMPVERVRVAQVRYEKALKQGDIVEIESDEEDEDMPPQVTTTEALEMCRVLGSFCLNTGAGSAMELSGVLRRFRAEVSQEYMQKK
jgi:hypothetical protein